VLRRLYSGFGRPQPSLKLRCSFWEGGCYSLFSVFVERARELNNHLNKIENDGRDFFLTISATKKIS
jgi:hypothetical protein